MTQEADPNERRNLYIAVGLIALGMISALLLGKSIGYNDGVYYGASAVCDDLDVGVDNNGEFVCYDRDEYEKPSFESVELTHGVVIDGS